MPTPAETARALSARGKGILASDESVPTIGKRLEKAGLANDEPTRRQYRDVYYNPRRPARPGGGGNGDGGAAGLGPAGISGAIVYSEALGQACCCPGPPELSFVDGLKHQGVLVGVKVDAGLEPLAGGGPVLPGETQTRGLAELPGVVRDAAARGAAFAKFRCALRMSGPLAGPSDQAVDVNARQLAEYAAVCLAGGGGDAGPSSALCPIVEPELLIDGAHGAAAFETASARVISATVAALWRQPGMSLDALLLKPQMVCPGSEWRSSATGGPSGPAGVSSDEVAARTLRVMRGTVPPAVPGIMFLSGGQTERQATENLDALNVLAQQGGAAGGAPWALSFSFGRGLQASVLKTWAEAGGGRAEATEEQREAAARAARRVAVALAEANGLAAKGEWRASGRAHPSVLQEDGTGGGGLHETFRGHY